MEQLNTKLTSMPNSIKCLYIEFRRQSKMKKYFFKSDGDVLFIIIL